MTLKTLADIRELVERVRMGEGYLSAPFPFSICDLDHMRDDGAQSAVDNNVPHLF
jgi:hypothetical protein